MNSKMLAITFKGIFRNWKNVLKIEFAVFLSFTFVTGILLFQSNMYNWQMAKAKMHFGDWFVMGLTEKNKKDIEAFEYVDTPVTAITYNEVYDEYEEQLGIKIGTFSEEFIKRNNIVVEQGSFPKADNEIAVDWNSLLELNQTYDIGDTIKLIVKDSDNETGYSEKTFILSGILTSYTNTWVNGKNLPGIIISENAVDEIKEDENKINLYPLKKFIHEKDYTKIYQRLCEDSDSTKVGWFNDAVYNNKPWENERLYQYMYILIMIIGVSSISYQIINYNKQRKNVRDILKRIGASKSQLYEIAFFENVVIIILAAVLGIIFTIFAGKIICENFIESGSVSFFYVDLDIYVKSFATIIIAIIISNLVNIIFSSGRISRKNRRNTTINVKNNLNKINFVRQTAKRLMRKSGIFNNIFIRVFAGVMATIMVFCIISVYNSYSKYNSLDEDVDLIGYNKENNWTGYYYFFYVDQEKMISDTIANGGRITYNSAIDIFYKYGIDFEDSYIHRSMKILRLNKNLKCGRTSLYGGINEDIINNINAVDGIKTIKYGYFETGRSWYWDDYDPTKLGAERYIDTLNHDAMSNGEKGKYLFASEYTDVDEELYDLICQYSNNSDISLEELRNGTAAIVFLDSNNSGEYDDTVKQGIDLYLRNYYDDIHYPFGYSKDGSNSIFSEALNKADYDLKHNDEIDKYIPDNPEKYYVSLQEHWEYYKDILNDKDKVIYLLKEFHENKLLYVDLFNIDMEQIRGYAYKLENNEIELSEMWDDVEILGNKNSAFKYIDLKNLFEDVIIDRYMNECYNEYYKPAATVKVADVIVVDDEIREAFKNIIPEFGQYTLLASTELAQKALDRQNEVNKMYFMKEELPEEIVLKLEPNQIMITNSLDSAMLSTSNIVESILRQSGFSCTSYSEEKNQYRQNTLNNMILYGFSALAAMVIYVLVCMVIVSNRIERNMESLRVLKQTGAYNSTLVRICMYECVRESLWCIIMLPIMITIDYLIIYKKIRRCLS